MPEFKPATTYAAVVGSVLVRERLAKNLQQSDLAAAVGVGPSTWSRIEKGESALSIDQLKLAAAALNQRPAQILDKAEAAEDAITGKGINVIVGVFAGAMLGNVIPVFGVALGTVIEAALAAAAASSHLKARRKPATANLPATD